MTNTLKDKVADLFSHHKVGTLATIRDNKPYSRFMMFNSEDLTLYTATNEQAHKAEDIAQNPNVHILLGYDRDSDHEHYVEIEANASVEESADLKEKFWSEQLKHWIASPEDPEYLLLKLTPVTILYYEKTGKEPQELTL
ncbi:pyridoxamine 5'-phosphate oxidase family protein [Bacillus haikouensis]|jgi:general stress protein 26|uniref:pyridoxamine 5'-phosphate oxidase family protein n=1 Tax=Bacillus haikouensis TaxID=1510468 RepID=UPI001557279E|nr:pyridoxamine 5'-phosphate oxidase family protein [Bacillus haikouensis]NQD66653.1 pyridoxamine 5'-phosphate oxidase family protein [Bacillus haikouensis]